jgi:hypothetical protein
LSDPSRNHSVESDACHQHARSTEDARKHRAELECEKPTPHAPEMHLHRSDIEDTDHGDHHTKHGLNIRLHAR